MSRDSRALLLIDLFAQNPFTVLQCLIFHAFFDTPYDKAIINASWQELLLDPYTLLSHAGNRLPSSNMSFVRWLICRDDGIINRKQTTIVQFHSYRRTCRLIVSVFVYEVQVTNFVSWTFPYLSNDMLVANDKPSVADDKML